VLFPRIHNLRAPFKVIIEFSGFPETGTKMGHMVGPALSKMIGENFRLWTTDDVSPNC
jgi:hypothetical protein